MTRRTTQQNERESQKERTEDRLQQKKDAETIRGWETADRTVQDVDEFKYLAEHEQRADKRDDE